jgi:hypothetical protein
VFEGEICDFEVKIGLLFVDGLTLDSKFFQACSDRSDIPDVLIGSTSVLELLEFINLAIHIFELVLESSSIIQKTLLDV